MVRGAEGRGASRRIPRRRAEVPKFSLDGKEALKTITYLLYCEGIESAFEGAFGRSV
jgi:hypothetical protein